MNIFDALSTIELPLVENYSYSEAKKFSQQLDFDLGFLIEEVEREILENAPQTPWAGLDPQALQTPYSEIRMMLSALQLVSGEQVIDFGAAYGRMGLVIAHFYKGVNFTGYEISFERSQEGQRIYDALHNQIALEHFGRLISDIQLLQEDISRTSFLIPEADVYFIYDFGDLESIIRVIDQLKKISMKKRIRVVGRGRRTRDQIERHEPWLSQVHAPQHFGNFSIYRS